MNENLIGDENNIIFYEDANGNSKVEVVLNEENVWLNSNAISSLFAVDRTVITKHINNIYKDDELEKDSTCAIFAHVGNNGKQKYNTKYYNLDMIISIGFRVNSKIAINFRKWATKILKEYMIKGFVIDKEKMKNGPKYGKDYYDELLETIKEIRLSERRLYQKITDVFEATSVDYNKKSEEAYTFFKIVQNKLHYAITGKTAAELIFERVDSEKIHMGLTNWKNSPDGKIMKYDISIAKNYLNEDEIKKLERLTISFLDYAEDMAYEHELMTMQKWINITDKLLEFREKKILKDSGTISHQKALEKASEEYEKFRIKQDREYFSSMDEMYKKYLEESK